MANINSFPNNQDIYIGAEPVMRWLHGRTSGVFGGDGNLAVEAVSGSYAVTVSDGTGWMSNDNADGVVVWIDNEDRTQNKLQLQPTIANAILPRIDRVVISWETTDYVDLPTVTILAGTPASVPTPPVLTNNNLMRQISLAQIRIPAGATQITSDMITDERLDESVCGIVTGTVQFDTTVMQAQFETLLAEIEQELGRLNAGTEAMMKTEYDPDGLGVDLGVQLYTHSKTGTVHNFVGTGMNGRAKITAAFDDGDTVHLNGAAVTATCGADNVDGDVIVEGKWVSFVADAEGGQLNFKGGGGLSSSKLAAANTAPGDVRTGKKFYAGDKTIKTGTLPVLHMGESHQINRWQNSETKEVFIQANTIPEGIYESDGNTWSPQINIPAELFGNAAAAQVLAGVTFTSRNGAKIAGTMPNQGAKTAALNAGGSYTIPQGWHNGSGKVTANSLASQTDANAAAGNILTGKTAWVKGSKIIGTMANRGAWGATINPGGSVTIPQGYHSGIGVVKANNATTNIGILNNSAGWGEGDIMTVGGTSAGSTDNMRIGFHWRADSDYNVSGTIRILRNGVVIDNIEFEKGNGYVDKSYSGSGSYQVQVNVSYHAGNGTFYVGGMMVGY